MLLLLLLLSTLAKVAGGQVLVLVLVVEGGVGAGLVVDMMRINSHTREMQKKPAVDLFDGTMRSSYCVLVDDGPMSENAIVMPTKDRSNKEKTKISYTNLCAGPQKYIGGYFFRMQVNQYYKLILKHFKSENLRAMTNSLTISLSLATSDTQQRGTSSVFTKSPHFFMTKASNYSSCRCFWPYQFLEDCRKS